MTSAASSPAAKRELPEAFVAMLGPRPEFEGLAEALSTTAPATSVRVNSAKGVAVPGGANLVSWCAQGFYLDERPDFTFDPALHQGLYYVQDASSMILSEVAKFLCQDKPLKWFDACAAPGGKTTAIIDNIPNGSLVVANEYDPRRARALVENLERWGAPNVIVTRGDLAQYAGLHHYFDVVSVDEPCSGEGMMRKDEAAVSQWSPSLVRECAALQREILDKVWHTLKPGGYLVYSTCTFNTTEDEEILAYLAKEYGAEGVRFETLYNEIATEVEGTMPALRFLPSRLRGEGLFLGIVRKPDGEIKAQRKPKDKGGKTKNTLPADWLNGGFSPISLDGEEAIRALPKAFVPDYHLLNSVLPPNSIIHAGVSVCTPKGKDILPAQALATSTILRGEAFAAAIVDYPTALAYLRGEAVKVDAPKGIVLLKTGDGRPLGFVKNLGNRANNLLPSNRRIQSMRQVTAQPVVI